VFEELYKKGLKKKTVNKTKEEIEFEKNKKECTFRPNIKQIKRYKSTENVATPA